MKNKVRFSRKLVPILLPAVVSLLSGSCTIGYHEEPEFSSIVQNTTLTPPEVTQVSSPDGSKTIISWPVVEGAGGYKFSLYNINEPSAPITIVQDTVIDGTELEIDRAEDTNYRLLAMTLGNDRYNNQASEEYEFNFTTVVPSLGEPLAAGTDLTQWFTDHRTEMEEQTEEFAIELMAGQNYTMSGKVDLSTIPITIRSTDKVTNATITMAANAGFETETSIKLKYLTFECSGLTDKSSSIVAYSKTHTLEKTAKHYLIHENKPTVFQNCVIKNLATRMIYDNGEPYAIQTILVQNCIVGLNQKAQEGNGTAHTIDLQKGMAFGFTLTGSTVYSTTESGKSIFLCYMNERPQNICNGLYPTASFTIENSTMVNITKTNSMASFSRWKGQANITLTVQNNIFVDCSKDRVARNLLQGQNGGMTMTFTNNCYWYDGAVTGDDWNMKDRVEADPQLTQTSEGYYTVGGAEVKAAGCGDPRGLQ